jgi:hypothetical protein
LIIVPSPPATLRSRARSRAVYGPCMYAVWPTKAQGASPRLPPGLPCPGLPSAEGTHPQPPQVVEWCTVNLKRSQANHTENTNRNNRQQTRQLTDKKRHHDNTPPVRSRLTHPVGRQDPAARFGAFSSPTLLLRLFWEGQGPLTDKFGHVAHQTTYRMISW